MNPDQTALWSGSILFVISATYIRTSGDERADTKVVTGGKRNMRIEEAPGGGICAP